MYIKVDSKPKINLDNDKKSFLKESENSYREVPNSLSFLNKPQRNKNVNEYYFGNDDELLRNTKLNRRLNEYSIANSISENDKGEDQTNNENNGDYKHDSSHPHHDNFYNSVTKRIAEVVPLSNQPSPTEADILPFEPIYKKSGEIVKSSLKYRSKSLPCTPNVETSKENDSKKLTVSIPRVLKRSKSVHFEQTTPIAYFNKDESPLDISLQFMDLLKLQGDNHNNLCINSIDDKNYSHANTLMVPDETENFSSDYEFNRYGNFQNNNNSNEEAERIIQANKKLRRSKLQSELFDKIKNEKLNKNRLRNIESGTDIDRELILENENFPILSRMKRRDILKINLYVKLVESNNVFLEELLIKKNVGVNETNDKFNMYSNINFLTGKIFVKNLHFRKSVKVRYTWNKWVTYHETEAIYNSNADSILPSTNMDIFRFIIDCNNLRSNCKNILELCINFTAGEASDNSIKEYWDNNNGKNYKIAIYK